MSACPGGSYSSRRREPAAHRRDGAQRAEAGFTSKLVAHYEKLLAHHGSAPSPLFVSAAASSTPPALASQSSTLQRIASLEHDMNMLRTDLDTKLETCMA
eukprot:5949222-Karenia_brevis.AAC.1